MVTATFASPLRTGFQLLKTSAWTMDNGIRRNNCSHHQTKLTRIRDDERVKRRPKLTPSLCWALNHQIGPYHGGSPAATQVVSPVVSKRREREQAMSAGSLRYFKPYGYSRRRRQLTLVESLNRNGMGRRLSATETRLPEFAKCARAGIDQITSGAGMDC